MSHFTDRFREKDYTNLSFVSKNYCTTAIAGEDFLLGEVAYVKQAGGTDGVVFKNPTNGDMPIGVVIADTLAGQVVIICTSGKVPVKPENATTAIRGYVIFSSAVELGRVDQSASIPSATQHFRECGHFIRDGTGAGVATEAFVHFN